MTENLDYGRRIRIGDADKIIQYHNTLDGKLGKVIDPNLSKREKEELGEFKNRERNAFVFDLEKIQKFITDGLDQNAKYLTVLLGAHPEGLKEFQELSVKQKAAYKNGSFTVVLALCERIGESKVLQTVNITDPAMQYPPGKPTISLEVDPSIGVLEQSNFLKIDFT